MPLNNQNICKQIGRIAAVCLTLLLCACSSDYASAVLGTWKEVNQERYLMIEKSTGLDTAMNAIIYAPSTAVSDGEQVRMNQLSMPAKIQNGILMLEVAAGQIPVLYDSINQQVVLNGTDRYERLPADLAQLKFDSVRVAN